VDSTRSRNDEAEFSVLLSEPICKRLKPSRATLRGRSVQRRPFDSADAVGRTTRHGKFDFITPAPGSPTALDKPASSVDWPPARPRTFRSSHRTQVSCCPRATTRSPGGSTAPSNDLVRRGRWVVGARGRTRSNRIDMGTRDWTVAAWINTTASGMVVTKMGLVGGAGPDGWGMSVSGNGTLGGVLHKSGGIRNWAVTESARARGRFFARHCGPRQTCRARRSARRVP
jgi:hypothetical protein